MRLEFVCLHHKPHRRQTKMEHVWCRYELLTFWILRDFLQYCFDLWHKWMSLHVVWLQTHCLCKRFHLLILGMKEGCLMFYVGMHRFDFFSPDTDFSVTLIKIIFLCKVMWGSNVNYASLLTYKRRLRHPLTLKCFNPTTADTLSCSTCLTHTALQ